MKMTLQQTTVGDNGSQNEGLLAAPPMHHPLTTHPATHSTTHSPPLFRFAYSHMHNILDLFALLALLCVSSALKDSFTRLECCGKWGKAGGRPGEKRKGGVRKNSFWPFDMQK